MSNSENGAMLSPAPAQIEVASGSFVDLANPDPATLQLAGLLHDAAEAYLGDVVAPLKYAMREESAGIITHGRFLNPYDVLSRAMDAAIAARFRIDGALFEHPAVAEADMWALRIEARTLTASGGAHWRWPGTLPHGGDLPGGVHWAAGADPAMAERVFIRIANELLTEVIR